MHDHGLRKLLVVLSAAWLAGMWLAQPARAHGASVDATLVEAVTVQARYDTGAPMAEARVIVFAPDLPERPWLTGQTDAAGRFVFVPEASEGRWAIQVRQAGHGAMAHIAIGENPEGLLPDPTPSQTWAQRVLMVACVLWGCIGTALYARGARRGRAT